MPLTKAVWRPDESVWGREKFWMTEPMGNSGPFPARRAVVPRTIATRQEALRNGIENPIDLAEQLFRLAERKHAGAVGKCLGGVGVNLEK